MDIFYLKHKAIDRKKWNKTIEKFGLPYAYDWYLDITCHQQWDVLITENYEYLMPLPWNAKLLGFRQLFQPILSQQLGVFGENLTDEIVNQFIAAIPAHFKLMLLNLNEKNELPSYQYPNRYLKKRRNMLLDLRLPYDHIWKNYSKGLRRRLKKAKVILTVQETMDDEKLVEFYQQNLSAKVPFKPKDYQLITALIQEILYRKKGKIFAIYQPNSSAPCTIGLFLFSHQRIINIFGASDEAGRAVDGMHFLIDYVMERYAATNNIFDFEGSEIPGIAEFFSSFGSSETAYFQYYKNDLPVFLRWLK